MRKFNTITIVGVGLIGGSLGLAIKKEHLAETVIGFGRNLKRLKEAKRIGAVDLVTTDAKQALKKADLVVICLPVQLIIKFSREIFPYLKKGCIITDVGSTKKEITEKLTKIFNRSSYFVGAHPLAGSHKSGIEFAKQDLFKNTTCIITPIKSTNNMAIKKVRNLWKKLGSRVICISPGDHDRLIAKTSHLPHIIAVTLTDAVLGNNSDKIKKFIATGFKDTTRIAASNPVLWQDICSTNRTNIIKSIEKFEIHLSKLKKLLKKNKIRDILTIFEKAKEKREKI